MIEILSDGFLQMSMEEAEKRPNTVQVLADEIGEVRIIAPDGRIIAIVYGMVDSACEV